MESQQLSPVLRESSEEAARPEALEWSPEVSALAEVARAVGSDCRIEPETYLEEVRVASAGE